MQYQVPQFIDVEDRIVGPLTLKQFIYIAIAFLIGFFSFFVLKIFIWVIFIIILGSAALAFAFIKYNGRSFSLLLKSMFGYFWRPRLYVWQKEAGGLSDRQSLQRKRDLEALNLKLNTSSQPIRRERLFRLPFLQRFNKTMQEKYEIFRKTTGEREVARRVDYK